MNPLYALGAIAAGILGMKGISKLRDDYLQEKERKNTPCRFDETISFDEFEEAARKATRKIKRIEEVNVDGPIVYCTVRSNSGISTWDFSIDFNDFGHVTGTYWLWSENDDSDIPRIVAKAMQDIVEEYISAAEKRDVKPKVLSFTCEDCGQNLSVPILDNNILVTCPICGSQYVIQ